MQDTNVKSLTGVTLSKIEGMHVNSKKVWFTAIDGRKWKMFHSQDCCECVTLEDVEGNPEGLVGVPIIDAEESTSSDFRKAGPDEYFNDSLTWTFYKFATTKGYVTLRWFGQSNGYYSESIDIIEYRPLPS